MRENNAETRFSIVPFTIVYLRIWIIIQNYNMCKIYPFLDKSQAFAINVAKNEKEKLKMYFVYVYDYVYVYVYMCCSNAMKLLNRQNLTRKE